MKIGYICQKIRTPLDGRSIYDKRLIQSLKTLKHSVDTLEIEHLKKANLSLWGRKVREDDITKAKSLKNECDTIIVSHEVLSDLAKSITPDLFIIHNLLCKFAFPKRIDIQTLYRLGSKNIYNTIFNYSKKTLTISKREHRLAKAEWPDASILVEPPGITPKDHTPPPSSFSIIKRSGSNDWLPKKASLLNKKEREIIESITKLKLTTSETTEPSFTIIEDRFLTGFKLKLLDNLYRSDMTFSLANLDEEVKWISPHLSLYNHCTQAKDIAFNVLNYRSRHTPDQLSEHRRHLTETFSWCAIAKRILNKIH